MQYSSVFARTDDVRLHWAEFCQYVFQQVAEQVHPSTCLPEALPDLNAYSAVNVISVGKGALAMAEALSGIVTDVAMRGIVVAPHDVSLSDRAERLFKLYTGNHPVPDERSVAAAKAALKCAATTNANELLLVLLTGGASALMCCPIEGIGLAQKQDIVALLLRSGAPIQDLNTVRRALSTVKGGGLLSAAAKAGDICTLAISDVVNDDPRFIGSGPTVPMNDTELQLAKTLLSAHGFGHLITQIPTRPVLPTRSGAYRIIGSSKQALEHLESILLDVGFHVVDLGADCEGEAQLIAVDHTKQIVSRVQQERQSPNPQPLAFVSGGELTVKVRGNRNGGPNQHYALALMAELPDPDVFILAFDTDGRDGVGDAAGACVDMAVRQNSKARDLEPSDYLHACDSGEFFAKVGGQLITGLSGTNVNDVRLICWFPT